MAGQADDDLYISSLTVAEIRRGVLEKPAGNRRRELETWFSGPEGPQALFAGRVLPFDEDAALVWAELMADGRARGRPRSALDTIIAAIAKTNSRASTRSTCSRSASEGRIRTAAMCQADREEGGFDLSPDINFVAGETIRGRRLHHAPIDRSARRRPLVQHARSCGRPAALP
jgi:predicted nucleic acid-binding protein